MTPNDIQTLIDAAKTEGQDILAILRPYLPVLMRQGPEFYKGFIANLTKGDMDAIRQDSYALMTPEERQALDAQVYKDLWDATSAQYEQRKLVKQVLTDIAMNLLLKALTAGVL